MAWLCEETKIKYPNATKCARKLLLPFSSSYWAECGFSAVDDFLIKKRNRLDIAQREDLRLKLSKLEPNIKKSILNLFWILVFHYMLWNFTYDVLITIS